MRWSCWFLLACGVVAGSLLPCFVPAGCRDLRLDRQHFHLNRDATDLVEITDAHWFELGNRFGDFDLEMDVSLGEGADLDVLLRVVEPRHLEDPETGVIGPMEMFAGRFTGLRMSTVGDGPGWRSRDALLTGGPGNGVGVAPGYLSTVWIQARGRWLRANVAGRQQPWQLADDVYGRLIMLTRGGNAVIHRLEIAPRGADHLGPSRWGWAGFGLLAAAVVLAFGLALGAQQLELVAGAVAMVGFVAWAIWQGDLELAFPGADAMLLVLTGAAAAASAFVVRDNLPLRLALVFAAAFAGDAGLRAMHHDSRVPDELFGPDAGNQLTEALGCRVRGPGIVHSLAQAEAGPRVFLLGGAPLYDVGGPGEHLELLLRAALRGTTRQAVEVLGPQTAVPDAAQQWRLFRDFYTAYRPAALVFGTLGEADDEVAQSAFADALAAAKRWCAEHDCRLVLFAGSGADAATQATLRAAAADDVPLVLAAADDAPMQLAQKLAAAIGSLLR